VKLPDFTKFEPLNKLRFEMGATELGSFTSNYSPDRLTREELDRLSRSGIDIPLEEVRILPDGTLAYKDSRVLLYIRDVYQYKGGEEVLPRYHVSDCRTLQDMRDKKRYERYVVATRDDGEFELNIGAKGSDNLRPAIRQLAVCQNCLAKLKFDGFDYSQSYPIKKAIVVAFTIKGFFQRYPKSLVAKVPTHTAATAPLNKYTDDFPQLSERLKRSKGWICDGCNRDLSNPQLRRYLQAHHISGMRNNNAANNLKLLCIGCHAEQPMHGHMKGLPEYSEFHRLISQQ